MAALGGGVEMLRAAQLNGIRLGPMGVSSEQGMIIQPPSGGASSEFTRALIRAIAWHRHQVAELPSGRVGGRRRVGGTRGHGRPDIR